MALEPLVFKLAAPTQAHGEEITTLTLRPVRGEDVAACGYPFTISNAMEVEQGATPDISFNAPAVVAMVARLAGVPRSTVASLTGGDIVLLGYAMVGLFFPSIQKSSSNGASISPGTGDSRLPSSLASILPS